jgi:hypothetical protein
LNTTKRLVLVALSFGVAVFFVEDLMCSYWAHSCPRLYESYFRMMVVGFGTHAVTIPSILWLLILVYALLKPDRKSTQVKAA